MFFALVGLAACLGKAPRHHGARDRSHVDQPAASELICGLCGCCLCAPVIPIGRLDLVKWLAALGPASTQRATLTQRASLEAAKEGHLDVVQWTHESGGPWDEQTPVWAAARGHLSVFRYATSKGFPVDKTAFQAAAYGGPS